MHERSSRALLHRVVHARRQTLEVGQIAAAAVEDVEAARESRELVQRVRGRRGLYELDARISQVSQVMVTRQSARVPVATLNNLNLFIYFQLLLLFSF